MPSAIHPRFAQRALEPRYGFSEAAALVGRPSQTLRRWALGNRRKYRSEPRVDEALIRIDGVHERGGSPLSFLNLLELRFLASFRDQMPLPAIRRALDYAGQQLDVDRPLLDVDFRTSGCELFYEYEERGERFSINASRQGQTAWPTETTAFLKSLDYDESERAAYRWWPLGKERPVLLDTSLNAGRPSTAKNGVRTIAIASRARHGWSTRAIADDVVATPAEVEAALELEGKAAAA
jgi:uncharacterized protein (DUF433 family)